VIAKIAAQNILKHRGVLENKYSRLTAAVFSCK